MLRCEVKLGLIKRLEIKTHLRQFYLHDYEHLDVDVLFSLFNPFRPMMRKVTCSMDSVGTDSIGTSSLGTKM